MASPEYAFATLVTSDAYAKGALVVAAAIRDLHTSAPHAFDTVCIVTPETVDVSTIKTLRKAFDVVIGVEVIEEDQAAGLRLLGRPDLSLVLTKLHVFRLVQYKKIVFLDADVLLVRPISHLFSLQEEFSAVPDVGWPDIFNSGVMVLTPGEDKFSEIVQLVKTRGSWDGGDQGVLNEWRGDNWNRLSFTYNTTPTAAYTYAPAYERFGSKISVIHFIGPNKPWAQAAWRPPFVHTSPTPPSTDIPPATQQSYAYSSLIDRWFDVYDRHFRADPIAEAPSSIFATQYESAWNNSSTPAVPTPVLGLDELKKLALQGSGHTQGESGEAQYRALPLEGRLDLIRPPPPPKIPSPEPEVTAPAVFDYGTHHHTTAHHDDSHSAPSHSSSSTSHPNTSSPHHRDDPRSLPPSQSQPVDSAADQPVSSHSGPPQGSTHETSSGSGHSSAHHFFSPSPRQSPVQSEEPRPPSPPLITWNPAVEPPPNVSTFVAQTGPIGEHYTNVWDLPPTSTHHRRRSSSHSEQRLPNHDPAPQPEDFFQAPVPPSIPSQLVREGHYANVSHASPDISKVSTVFPWEEQSRPTPRRVFPVSEAPPPNHPLVENPTPILTIQQPTPERRTPPKSHEPRAPYMSPSPSTGSNTPFTNVWDDIPSIQRYVSRLVRPPHVTQNPSTEPILKKGRRNSQIVFLPPEDADDGDDEDDESSAGEDDHKGGYRPTPTRHRRTDSGRSMATQSSSSPVGGRSAGSSRRNTGSTERGEVGKYRNQGVQTVPKPRANRAVQTPPDGGTMGPISDPITPRARISPRQSQTNFQAASPTRQPPNNVPALSTGVTFPVTSPPPAPIALLRKEFSPSSPSAASSATLRDRTSSIDSDTTRMSWSAGQAGPLLGQSPPVSPRSSVIAAPAGKAPATQSRSGTRVWDPATGVDVFKRDSQEVLARFLRMSQWGEGGGEQQNEV